MKKVLFAIAFAVVTFVLSAGCHNTGRQIRKTVDSTHDLLLEGTD